MKNATRVTVSTYGTILSIAGLEHGVGEMLQGSITPSGIMIESWPDIEAYKILAGEPAMTIIPNLLLSGILTMIVSIILMIWAVKHIEKKNGGQVLILLSLILLLIGGGFGPPIMGFIVGWAGTKINSPLRWSAGRSTFGKIWPFIFVASIIGYFSLWPGLVILSQFFPAASLPVTQLTLFSFSTLILALLSSFAYDNTKRTNVRIQD
ncbi:hypothetical protein ES708_23609 [subsurface metagenome]